jgi:hypothetical protein
VLAKRSVARNELRAAQVLAHYIFVRGMVDAFDLITLKSRSNPALFFVTILAHADSVRCFFGSR